MMEENYELAKWLAGEMTDNELEAFKKTPEYQTYTKIKAFSAEFKSPDFESDELYQKVIQPKKEKNVFTLQSNIFFKVAAAIVLFIGIGFLYLNLNTTTQIAESGKRTSFFLPDSSQVVLNAVSQLTYKKFNWKNNRECQLNGEAFFKVAKGKTFDINTSLGKVTVIGTQFNVKSRKNRFEVECFEGKVKVAYNSKTTFITKGQNIVIQDGEQINALPSHLSEPNWINNEMKFISNDLVDIIAEIERQYNISIDLNNIISKQKFTGTLPTNNIHLALEIICTTYDLKLVRKDKKLIIVSNAPKNQ